MKANESAPIQNGYARPNVTTALRKSAILKSDAMTLKVQNLDRKLPKNPYSKSKKSTTNHVQKQSTRTSHYLNKSMEQKYQINTSMPSYSLPSKNYATESSNKIDLINNLSYPKINVGTKAQNPYISTHTRSTWTEQDGVIPNQNKVNQTKQECMRKRKLRYDSISSEAHDETTENNNTKSLGATKIDPFDAGIDWDAAFSCMESKYPIQETTKNMKESIATGKTSELDDVRKESSKFVHFDSLRNIHHTHLRTNQLVNEIQEASGNKDVDESIGNSVDTNKQTIQSQISNQLLGNNGQKNGFNERKDPCTNDSKERKRDRANENRSNISFNDSLQKSASPTLLQSMHYKNDSALCYYDDEKSIKNEAKNKEEGRAIGKVSTVVQQSRNIARFERHKAKINEHNCLNESEIDHCFDNGIDWDAINYDSLDMKEIRAIRKTSERSKGGHLQHRIEITRDKKMSNKKLTNVHDQNQNFGCNGKHIDYHESNPFNDNTQHSQSLKHRDRIEKHRDKMSKEVSDDNLSTKLYHIQNHSQMGGGFIQLISEPPECCPHESLDGKSSSALLGHQRKQNQMEIETHSKEKKAKENQCFLYSGRMQGSTEENTKLTPNIERYQRGKNTIILDHPPKNVLPGETYETNASNTTKKSPCGSATLNQMPITPSSFKVKSKQLEPSVPLISLKPSPLPPLPAEIDYDRKRILPVDDGYRTSLIKNANISKPMLNGWKLHQWQKAAVLRGLKLRRMVLAYDMGLGKTLIACVWAKAFKQTFHSLKVYVIAPVSLREEWKKTATNATGMVTAPEKTSKNEADEKNLDMCITTWGKVPKEVPAYVHYFVVICDEAHQMQSMNSARTKDVLNLTSEKRCIGCLLVTGTPMKNGKPLNLFPLLKAVNHPFGDEQKIYEIMFCAGRERRFGPGKKVWDANGSSNLPILNAHISSHVLHLTKEDCLKNLPPKTRVMHKVAVSRHFQIMYTNRINDLTKATRSCEGLDNKDMGEALLGSLQKVRFAASIAKVDAAVALTMSKLEKEPAIVIFTSFVEVAKTVHRKLCDSGWNGEILTGETPSSKRAQIVENFQTGLAPIFIATFGAGGQGLTLTAACTIILLDRPWTPGDALQAEDRVRRIGQTKPVLSIWMTAFEVDEQIDGMIEQKNINSNLVIEGKGDNSCGTVVMNVDSKMMVPKISIMQLVKKIIPNEKDSSYQGLKHTLGAS